MVGIYEEIFNSILISRKFFIFFPLLWDPQTYNTTTIVVGNEAALLVFLL
jgi:hypothetical protein